MKLSIVYPAPATRPTIATSLVADIFGLDELPPQRIIARDLDVPIESGMRLAISGPSGTGKSSILIALARRLEADGARVAWPDRIRPRNALAIDTVPLDFPEAVRLLSSCGLSEPRLLIQRPAELSTGQRWRLRLAIALARRPDWIVLDEFAAALDATLARVLAFNLRRQSIRQGCGVLMATCHPGPISDFDPDLRITCEHQGSITVLKKTVGERACFHSSGNSTSPPAPARTGRISRGGITAPPASARCGS